VTVELKALQQQVKKLEADLTPTGLADPKLKAEWQDARTAERTASAFEAWLAERVTQVAVGWVLSTVFVRFCEDNGLIEYPFIAGPGERTALARDLQQEFYERHPERGDRDWLKASFDALSVSPVAKALFDEHNPMWSILPSPDQAKALLDFWRQTGEDGELRYDLTDPEWNTRFLGDLYQDLSESARKTYALLQTPEFVEEFILNYTLDPAIEEFGLEPEPPYGHAELPHRLRVIDPACGSGHFLLGAFRRLLAAWQTYAPTTDTWDLIANALSSVHGVDKNPFAVAIARFRLMLATMRAGNVTRLSANVNFPINIAVGDSLLHGKGAPGIQGELEFDGEKHVHTYRTEDIDDYIKSAHILEVGTYHVVVGNPPYITVKDKQENANYRKAYKSCSGKYALSVPFAERIFQLAIRGAQDGADAGYTGQITANSFMKREFGKKLIEEYFPTVDVTHVIDTSGASIPGHGTPTVILIGRRRYSRPNSTIRAVLGVRGEPGQPANPANGRVWKAIAEQVRDPGSESEWVSAADLPRSQFSKYPWSLGGGGAGGLLERIACAPDILGSHVRRIGFYGVTGADDAMTAPLAVFAREYVERDFIFRLVVGDDVRDWEIRDSNFVFHPYGSSKNLLPLESMPRHAARLWPFRTEMGNRQTFTKGTYFTDGRPWHEWHQLPKDEDCHPWFLAFAIVSTHNHFVLDRGGKSFKQTAPVIKLPVGASEDDHLALLGVLNSSTTCFWIKQKCQNRGSTLDSRGARQTTVPWEDFYEVPGGLLKTFPLPADLAPGFGRSLDVLHQQLAVVEPSAVAAAADIPTRERLDAARDDYHRIRSQMIALQEELDWDVYHRYGLLTDDEAAGLIAQPESLPDIDLGRRAFEIVLARKVASGEAETQWFVRHHSTPVTEIPREWPEEYRDVVARRIEMIERDRNIGLIERPECKRRWQSDPWETKEREALTTWLLDRCEERSIWYGPDDQPRPMTVNRLADRLRADADVVSVARLLAGPDADLADVLASILADEHVPCLARARYKPEGLLKRAIWEQTWELQRAEDRTGKRLDIPVPPKYTSADFLKNSYWRHRGKLDVPKERFISYPYSGPHSDKSTLLGWAGWDHREQAYALIATIEERTGTDGWEGPDLIPLVAGLVEVMPWVRQWHHERDKDGRSPADEYDVYLAAQREKYALTDEILASWSPPAATRGRRKG
jgi:hypothetical protein